MFFTFEAFYPDPMRLLSHLPRLLEMSPYKSSVLDVIIESINIEGDKRTQRMLAKD